MKNNNRGFTLIEFMVTVGLSGLVISIIALTTMIYNRSQFNLNQSFENSIDTSLAEKILVDNLKNAEISYNNLVLLDNTGKPFFDYYPDRGSQDPIVKSKREITLKKGGAREFYLLAQDLNAGPLMIYDPVAAYAVGATPVDPNVSATLTYVSLNQNSWVVGQRPNFWKPNQLLMLDTPTKIRPGNGPAVDYSRKPRSPIYVGIIQAGDLQNIPSIENYIDVSHPETGAIIHTPDEFLRTLPAQGGSLPLVRLRGVELYKYYFEPHTEPQFPNLNKLVRVKYTERGFGKPFLIADRLISLTLTRNQLNQKVILFKFEKQKDVR